MSEKTAISWCDATFNPWWQCRRVSPACDNCYAATLAARFGYGWDGPDRRTFDDKHWQAPIRWAKTMPTKLGRRPRVFCASMGDVFDRDAPPFERARLWRLIHETPQLDWLLLTKRIGNAHRMLPPEWVDSLVPRMPDNVWLGATVVNQEEVDRDIPKLLGLPARVRFLSVEPMLGPVDLQKPCTARCPNRTCFATKGHPNDRSVIDSEQGGITVECICSRLNGLHWVIAGGESGPRARPLHVDWLHSLVRQCKAAGVAVHVKQLGREVYSSGITQPGEHWPQGSPGEWDGQHFVQRLQHVKGGDLAEWPEALRVQEFPA